MPGIVAAVGRHDDDEGNRQRQDQAREGAEQGAGGWHARAHRRMRARAYIWLHNPTDAARRRRTRLPHEIRFLPCSPPSRSARPPTRRRCTSQAELDALLAPIALQTDGVLSQVLMAATYPEDVAAAAAWSRANPHLRGDAAVRAADEQPWDPSVKSLLAFPELLARMDESPQWLRDLGEAFLGQQAQVMDTVQGLRRRAQANGQLVTSDDTAVYQQGEAIVVQPRSAGRLRALLRSLRRVRAVVVGPVLPPGRVAAMVALSGVRRARLFLQRARLAPPACARRASAGARASPSRRTSSPASGSTGRRCSAYRRRRRFRGRCEIAYSRRCNRRRDAQADRAAACNRRRGRRCNRRRDRRCNRTRGRRCNRTRRHRCNRTCACRKRSASRSCSSTSRCRQPTATRTANREPRREQRSEGQHNQRGREVRGGGEHRGGGERGGQRGHRG